MTFEMRSLVRAPVERVFRFHEREDAIQLLTPPWQPMKVLRRVGGLETGAEVEFRVWMGPIPVRWLARHVDYARNECFVDVQERGPFAMWRHEHRFERKGEHTVLVDSVEYALPGAPLTHWLLGWAMQLQLGIMFRYRHAATRRWCEQADEAA